VQQGKLALERKRSSGAAFNAITYVPIRPHIFRYDDGSGGLTLANLNQIMAITNSHFLSNGYGIQFYFAGTIPDYIDNSYLLNNFAYADESTLDGRDATNALNQYYVNRFLDNAIGGYAKSPSNGNHLFTTRSFIATNDNDSYRVAHMGHHVVPHELGHTFGLYHTFGYSNGTAVTDELVTRGAGANCETSGDLICDTPADPYGMVGANILTVNGCPQYDPSSTARDANGEAFSPMISNIMGYWYSCTQDFTPDSWPI
jgi:hypothetical protein